MNALIRALLVAALGLLPSLVYAEDIDIYMEPRGEAGSEPLVRFNLEYRSNRGSSFNICAADRAFFGTERQGPRGRKGRSDAATRKHQ